MSFITEQEASSITIRRMILHVVGGEDGFEAQAEMQDFEHAPFFLERIRGAAVDGVHSFEDASETKRRLERMARGELTFETGGQELARAFSKAHVEASRDGAFFLFELEVGLPDTVLYSLVKYDYRSAIEFTAKEGKQSLRAIVQAFVKERRAIQKSCFVRVVAGQAETLVSAFDRMGRAPDLTDYFRNFLDVKRSRSDHELSVDLNEMLRATLTACREFIPNRDVPAALEASKVSLRGREVIDESAMREAIYVGSGRSDDEATRVELDRSATREIKRLKLAGVEFRPTLAVLAQRPRRQIKTIESVVLSYPGEEEGKSVRRERQPDGQGWIITIRTQRDFIEDATLAIKSRGSA